MSLPGAENVISADPLFPTPVLLNLNPENEMTGKELLSLLDPKSLCRSLILLEDYTSVFVD